MKLTRSPWYFAVLVLAAFLLPVSVRAEEAQEGINSGNYNIKHSVELGYRWTDFTGNQPVFDTFVNLQQGPRLLGQTLEMRSLNRSGTLFDDLYTTSFGYGGDPNNLSILRVSKDKWYNFNGRFRRDRNLWNYNLLANPLNPTDSSPFVPILYSPHLMRLSRRMSDLNLTLLPQSRVRFRLGYSRNINEGPSLSTFHEGTDVLLFQDWKTTLNSYQIGVDFKVLPRTNFSYDQFLQYYRGDTSWADQNLTYQLADGTPVDLGLPFNTKANQPCAKPIADATTTPPTITPTCNGYLYYARSGPMRTSYPTEQLSFQSSSIKNLDMAGRLVYSSGEAKIPVYDEFFRGRVTRTQQRQFAISGPVSSKRVSASADFAATYAFTPKLRLVDEFRFVHFRIPGQWASAELSLFGSSLLKAPVTFDPAACPPPYKAATCPTHGSSSPADVASGVSSLFLGQDVKLNTVQLEYDLTKRLGGRLGYRYRHRTITMRDFESVDDLFYPTLATRGGCTASELEPDGSCHVTESASDGDETVINEHSLLLGIWTRPVDPLRVTFDMELMSADNSLTRISPRQFQHYKLRANYKPATWMSFGGTVNVYEARNNVPDINHLQHSRSYGFNTTLAPKERWALDLGYDYNNIFSHTNICYALAAVAPPGSIPCPILAPGVASLAAIALYNNTTHFGYGDLMVKPVKRVTINLGYAINSVTGSTLILNPNAPPGPLQFNYHKPYASLAVDLVKGLTWKTAWGFYEYDEKVQPGDPTGSRKFRGNLLTLSMGYAF